eukprot:s702_g3.t1
MVLNKSDKSKPSGRPKSETQETLDLRSLSLEWDANEEIRTRLREGGGLLVDCKGEDIQSILSNLAVLQPFITRMSLTTSRPLPLVETLRDEVEAIHLRNKRGSNPEDVPDVIAIGWKIRKMLTYVKMKEVVDEVNKKIAQRKAAREAAREAARKLGEEDWELSDLMHEEVSDSNAEAEDAGGEGDDNSSSEGSEDTSDDEVGEPKAKTEPGKHEVMVVGEEETMGDTGTPSNNTQKQVAAEPSQVEAKVVVAAESQNPEDTLKTALTEKTNEKVPGASMCSPMPEGDIAKTQQGTTPSAPKEQVQVDGEGKGGSFVGNKKVNYVFFIVYQFFICVAKFTLPIQR